MRSNHFRLSTTTFAFVLASVCLARSTFADAATTDSLRDRIRQRVEQHEANGHVSSSTPGFPDKGQLSTATPVTLDFGGLHRRYLIQVPQGSGPFPVVILLHGGTQSAEEVWRQTSFPTLASRNGFILVAPEGVNGHWNDGRGSTMGGGVSTADDVGFLSAVIADVVRSSRGDASAVFMTGVSNGGMMTMRFACERADLLRAAGNVISDLPAALRETCRPGKPLPWISINGTRDPLMPFEGQSAKTDFRGNAKPDFLSANATFDFWAANADCADRQTTEPLPDLDSTDDSRAEKRVRVACAGGTPSTQYVLIGAGHVAPGLPIKSGLVRAVLGKANMDIDMGTVVWQHFANTLSPRR
jgi:polyhydroxybutyrate depolymerase